MNVCCLTQAHSLYSSRVLNLLGLVPSSAKWVFFFTGVQLRFLFVRECVCGNLSLKGQRNQRVLVHRSVSTMARARLIRTRGPPVLANTFLYDYDVIPSHKENVGVFGKKHAHTQKNEHSQEWEGTHKQTYSAFGPLSLLWRRLFNYYFFRRIFTYSANLQTVNFSVYYYYGKKLLLFRAISSKQLLVKLLAVTTAAQIASWRCEGCLIGDMDDL